MGCYVNPPDTTKEAWLVAHGRLLVCAARSIDITNETLPVCLVDNGPFTAAGVCYNIAELEAFQYPDGRPKKWYIVDRENLRTVSDLAHYER